MPPVMNGARTSRYQQTKTSTTRRANAIAYDVREKGRNVKNEKGEEQVPGTLKSVKAIGWYIEEYG